MHALLRLSNSGAMAENAGKPAYFTLSTRQAEENSQPPTPRRQNWPQALAGKYGVFIPRRAEKAERKEEGYQGPGLPCTPGS